MKSFYNNNNTQMKIMLPFCDLRQPLKLKIVRIFMQPSQGLAMDDNWFFY